MFASDCLEDGLGAAAAGPRLYACPVGAKDCKPEIHTSEIIVDFQWHFPRDFQWHFPAQFHMSVVFSKGLSLVQWSLTGISQWAFSGIFQWKFTFMISGVQYFALILRQVPQAEAAALLQGPGLYYDKIWTHIYIYIYIYI